MSKTFTTYFSYQAGQRYVLNTPLDSWYPSMKNYPAGTIVSFHYLAHNHYDEICTVNFETNDAFKIAIEVEDFFTAKAESPKLAGMLTPLNSN